MKNIKIVCFLFSIISFLEVQAQNYQITFAVWGQSDTIDSIRVENLLQGTTLYLNGDDVLHLVANLSGLENIASNEKTLKVYPNPINETANLEFYNPHAGKVTIEIYDMNGNRIIYLMKYLSQGNTACTISGLTIGKYLVNVKTKLNTTSVVLISENSTNVHPSLSLLSNNSILDLPPKDKLKSTVKSGKIVQMQYNDGDSLRFTAKLNELKAIVEIIPVISQEIDFNFAPIVSFKSDSIGVVNSVISFRDNSGNSPVSWIWDFGDSTEVSTEQNPNHTYSKSGIYTISLSAVNNYGTNNKTSYIEVFDVIDIDSNYYYALELGTQTWMAENLKTTRFNDGSHIEKYIDSLTWANNVTGAYCWYNHDEINNNVYGALYNYYAVNSEELCPVGWHVPTEEEWYVLFNYVGGAEIAGGKLKEDGYIHWISPNKGATDSYGFRILPGGYFNIYYGEFRDLGETGYLWTSTPFDNDVNSGGANFIFISTYSESASSYLWNLTDAFSVRCIKD